MRWYDLLLKSSSLQAADLQQEVQEVLQEGADPLQPAGWDGGALGALMPIFRLYFILFAKLGGWVVVS